MGFRRGEGSFTKGSGATGAAFKLGHTDKEVLDMMRERLLFTKNKRTPKFLLLKNVLIANKSIHTRLTRAVI